MYIHREDIPQKPDDAILVYEDWPYVFYKGNEVWNYNNKGELIRYAKFKGGNNYQPYDVGRPFEKIWYI